MTMSIVPVRRLLTAIVDLYRAEAALSGPAANFLASVLQAIAATPYPRVTAAQEDAGYHAQPPVRDILANLEGDGPLDAILKRLLAAEPHLDWMQDGSVVGAGAANAPLRQGYGGLEIVGPQRTFKSPSTTIGFWLLAPGLTLPIQSHAAEQTCHIVSGEAEWSVADGPWRTMIAGALIHHAPGANYTARTLMRPVLVLYCRRGDPTAASGKGAAGRQGRSPKRAGDLAGD